MGHIGGGGVPHVEADDTMFTRGSVSNLGASTVHIHLCEPEGLSEADVEAASSTLDANERMRASRFLSEADRLTYVVAHGLLRTTLAVYSGIPARALEF